MLVGKFFVKGEFANNTDRLLTNTGTTIVTFLMYDAEPTPRVGRCAGQGRTVDWSSASRPRTSTSSSGPIVSVRRSTLTAPVRSSTTHPTSE